MGKLYGLNGQVITQTEEEGRLPNPMQKVQTPEGLFDVPIVLLADAQFNALVDAIYSRISHQGQRCEAEGEIIEAEAMA